MVPEIFAGVWEAFAGVWDAFAGNGGGVVLEMLEGVQATDKSDVVFLILNLFCRGYLLRSFR